MVNRNMKKTIFVFLVAAFFIGTTFAGASALNKTDGKPEISIQGERNVYIEVKCYVDSNVFFSIDWDCRAKYIDTTITIKNTETNEETILTYDDNGIYNGQMNTQEYRLHLDEGTYNMTCHIDIPPKLLVVKENNLKKENLFINGVDGDYITSSVYFTFEAGYGIKPRTKNSNFVSIIDNFPVIRQLLQRFLKL